MRFTAAITAERDVYMTAEKKMAEAGWKSDRYLGFTYNSGKLSLTCLALGIGFTLPAFFL